MELYGEKLGELAYEWWGQYGVPVFPCDDDKVPLCRWQKSPSTDKEAVLALFRSRGKKARRIGAAMGEQAGLFAVDFDFYKGPAAQEYFDTLMLAGALPPTRVHKTAGGGIHYIYAVPEGKKAPRNSVPHDGVEVRGEGGYIVVPPTPGYVVQDDGLTDANDILIDRLRRADAAFRSLSVSGLKEKIINGDMFHEALTAMSAKLNAAGFPPDHVQKEMMEAMNASVASNPHHERHSRWKSIMEGKNGELARIASSGFKKFNPNKDSGDVTLVASRMAKILGNRSVTLGGFFAEKPATEDDEKRGVFGQPKATSENTPPPSGFPFARSYHAALAEEESDKPFLVYPLVMQGDVVVLSASPKAGKTLTTMNLCLHAAAGIPIGDHLIPMNEKGETAKVPVIYFALEGQGAIRERIKGWLIEQRRQGRDLKEEDLYIYVVEQSLNLADDNIRQTTVDNLMKANAYFKNIGWGEVGIVVFDTLTKAMPGSDQNSVEDTSKVFSTVDMMKEVGLTPAVFFIHHNNKTGNGPRGSGNIMAEPDTLLTVQKLPPIVEDGKQFDCYELSVFMARAIDDAQIYRFKANEVELGVNRQNIMKTAPVISVIDNYSVGNTVEEGKLKKVTAKIRKTFYDDVWKVLADATDSTLSLGRMHRLFANHKDASVSAFYSSHLNGTTAGSALEAWKILLHEKQVPTSMQGMTFEVTEAGVTMKVDLGQVKTG